MNIEQHREKITEWADTVRQIMADRRLDSQVRFESIVVDAVFIQGEQEQLLFKQTEENEPPFTPNENSSTSRNAQERYNKVANEMAAYFSCLTAAPFSISLRVVEIYWTLWRTREERHYQGWASIE